MNNSQRPPEMYADLESIWLSKPTYLERRMPLEQAMLDNYSKQDLQLLIIYLDNLDDKLANKIKDLRAIKSIARQVVADMPQP